MAVRHYFLALLPLVTSLGGCAGGDDGYPSLAMRPFESAQPAPATPAPSPPAPTRPLASQAELAALVARADAADGQFTRQRPAADRLVRAAAGQPVESNVRAAALVAMADLTASRGATSAVLADLDRLAADSAVTFAPDAEITAALGAVLALVEGQDAAMAQLWQGLER